MARNLYADYRYYWDDWRVESHVLEAGWHQILGQGWRLTPSLRRYSQSQAYFYAPYYMAARGDGLASSDYRLSPYGALSARLDLNLALGGWSVAAGAEVYQARGDYALRSVQIENPGLVEYAILNASFSYRF